MKSIKQFLGNNLRTAKYVTVVLMFSLLISFSSCSKDETADPIETPTGTVAPSFELKSLTGSTVKLSDFKNKVVVLFFFGNACPSCKAAAPDIQTMLQGTFGSNASFMLLGLDQWDGNAASVESFMKSTGVTFPLLLMASPTAKAYSTTYDRIVVIDKNGNIMFDGKQGAGSDLAAAKAKIEMLLK